MREQRRLQIFHLAFAVLMAFVVMAVALGVVFVSAPPEARPLYAGEPLILAVLIASGCGLVVMVVGTGVILRATRPLIQRIVRSEERSRELLEATTDGVIDFDERGKITALNPAAEKAFGYKRRALLGQPVTRLLIGHGGDAALGGTGVAPAVRQSQAAAALAPDFPLAPPGILGDLLGECRGLKTQGQRSDGTVFPVEVTIVEEYYEGESTFVAVVRDLSESEAAQRELAESEERFRI
ncbi:MAG: PAS domain S-box protein, partial [bacterium]|nr:PAS domain S-box protein [bacterium]